MAVLICKLVISLSVHEDERIIQKGEVLNLLTVKEIFEGGRYPCPPISVQ